MRLDRWPGRSWWHAWCWPLLIGFTSACAPMAQQVRDMAQQRPGDAAEHGLRWLARTDSVAASEEADAVRVEVAQALMAQAARSDNPNAWAAACARVPESDATAGLAQRYTERHAAAVYRDVVLPSRRHEAHRSFRRRFPASALCEQSEREEARLALDAARSVGTALAFERYREQYASLKSAASYLAEARELEAEAAFREATATGTVGAWSSFCGRYPQSRLLPRALRNEIGLAYEHAQRSGQVADLRRFIEVYGRYPEAAQYVQSIRGREVAHARAELRMDEDAALEGFVTRYESWPEAVEAVGAVRRVLLQLRLDRAVRAADATALEQFITMHREWPEADPQVRAARRELVRIVFAGLAGAPAIRSCEFIKRFAGWREADAELPVARAACSGR